MSLAIDLGVVVGGTIAISIFGIVFGFFLLGVDRRIHAHMQARVGPMIRQPFRDLAKLLAKTSVVPDNAVASIFNLAPVIALAGAIVVLLYLPFGSFALPLFGGWGDLILILYLLTIPSLAMVAGGFASSSPYATIGAQREMVTMIAYEFPLAIAIVAVAWRLSVAGVANPFTVGAVAANPVWGVVGPLGLIGFLILFVVLAWVTPAELSRVPCDTPEAETELCGGILVEYSGRNLGLFSAAMGVKTVAMVSLAVVLFLPWNIAGVLGLSGTVAYAADFIFYVLKVLLVMIVSVTLLRTGMARFRINHVVTMYWGILGIAGLVGLALIMADVFLGMGVIA